MLIASYAGKDDETNKVSSALLVQFTEYLPNI